MNMKVKTLEQTPTMSYIGKLFGNFSMLVEAGVAGSRVGPLAGAFRPPRLLPKKPTRFKLPIFAVALITLLFLFPLSASARASITNAGSGRIFGQLLNGTKKNAPVVGQKVTLQMAQDNTAR